MNAVVEAIWFIETHFSEQISLDDIAKSAGGSRYHVVRAFGIVTGRSHVLIWEDRTTIVFAELVEREVGGFVTPPAFRS
jgi:AraC-like DNA-binding protein